MKFNKIFIPAEISKITEGIEEINLVGLGQVVALVGKNGSGKSRILRLIENNLISSLDIAHLLDGTVTNVSPGLEDITRELLPFKDYYITNYEREIV